MVGDVEDAVHTTTSSSEGMRIVFMGYINTYKYVYHALDYFSYILYLAGARDGVAETKLAMKLILFGM